MKKWIRRTVFQRLETNDPRLGVSFGILTRIDLRPRASLLPTHHAGQRSLSPIWKKKIFPDHDTVIYDRAPRLCKFYFRVLDCEVKLYGRPVHSTALIDWLVLYCRSPIAGRFGCDRWTRGFSDSARFRCRSIAPLALPSGTFLDQESILAQLHS